MVCNQLYSEGAPQQEKQPGFINQKENKSLRVILIFRESQEIYHSLKCLPLFGTQITMI